MCFCPPATSVSRRRRALSPSSPPRIAALLHIDKPREREALDQLHSYTTGPRRMWRVLAMRRDRHGLRVAVEWVRRRQWFALVTFAFTDGSVTCRFKKTERAALRAMRSHQTDGQPASAEA